MAFHNDNKKTEEVPGEDWVDYFAEYSMAQIFKNEDRMNLGDLWNGTAEFRPDCKVQFEECHPNYSRFMKPLSYGEAAQRMRFMKAGRALMKDDDLPPEVDKCLQDCSRVSFLTDQTVMGRDGTQVSIPTRCLETWCMHTKQTADTPQLPAAQIVVPPVDADVVTFRDRKGKRAQIEQLAPVDGLSKKYNRPIPVLHKLHAVEAIQLCNLCPQSVREAVNLIPTLARFGGPQIWYYVNELQKYVKDEDNPAIDNAAYMGDYTVNALLKKRKVGLDALADFSYALEDGEDGRLLVAGEERLQRKYGPDAILDKCHDQYAHLRKDATVHSLTASSVISNVQETGKLTVHGNLTATNNTMSQSVGGTLMQQGNFPVGGTLRQQGGTLKQQILDQIAGPAFAASVVDTVQKFTGNEDEAEIAKKMDPYKKNLVTEGMKLMKASAETDERRMRVEAKLKNAIAIQEELDMRLYPEAARRGKAKLNDNLVRGYYFGMYDFYGDPKKFAKEESLYIELELRKLKFLKQEDRPALNVSELGPFDKQLLDQWEVKGLGPVDALKREEKELEWYNNMDAMAERGIVKGPDIRAEKGYYMSFLEERGLKGAALTGGSKGIDAGNSSISNVGKGGQPMSQGLAPNEQG